MMIDDDDDGVEYEYDDGEYDDDVYDDNMTVLSMMTMSAMMIVIHRTICSINHTICIISSVIF